MKKNKKNKLNMKINNIFFGGIMLFIGTIILFNFYCETNKSIELSNQSTKHIHKENNELVDNFWNGECAETFEAGEGSIDSPYLISNGAQLKLFSNIINRITNTYNGNIIIDFSSFNSSSVHYEITKDIYLNETINWQDWASNSTGLYNWIPIGNENNSFKGYLDGKGKIISGIYINDNTLPYQGLFGYLNGFVKNIIIEKSLIAGRSYIGSIAGSINDGEIANCINNGNVIGEQYVGGIAGQSLNTNKISKIKDCFNSGLITGNFVATSRSTMIGGIVGENNGIIDNCNNNGNLSLESKAYVGGIVGQNSYQVINSYNMGSFTITQNAADRYGINSRIGGIVGSNYAAGIENDNNKYIKNCFNTGAIEGKANDVGGVAGYSAYDIYDCYNSGNLSISGATASGLGGVVGSVTSCSIKRCYNTGTITDITNISFIGGLIGVLTVGNLTANIDSCYNAGSINKIDEIKKGSLIGYVANKINIFITNCYYDKSISSTLGVVFLVQGTNIDIATDNESNNIIGLTTSEMTSENILKLFTNSSDWILDIAESDEDAYLTYYPQLIVFTTSKNNIIVNESKKSVITRYDYSDWEHITDSEPSMHNRESSIYIQTESCIFSEWEISIVPSCSTSGEETRVCSICKYIERRIIPALEHIWIDANCTTSKTCSICGITEGESLGHNVIWITILEPTCITAGIKEFRCTVCNEVLDTDIIPALGHNFDDIITPPTYNTTGFTTHTCNICDYSYTDNILPMLNYKINIGLDNYVSSDFFDNYILGDILLIPNREGYTFDGWYIDEELTLPITSVTAKDLNSNGNITLYVKWIANSKPSSNLSGGEIAGIIIGSTLFISISSFTIVWFFIKKKTITDLIKIFK